MIDSKIRLQIRTIMKKSIKKISGLRKSLSGEDVD